MRIMFSSNGPHVPTGYGTQSKWITSHLLDVGHEVAFFAWWGLQGGPIKASGGMTIYPRYEHPFGADVGIWLKHHGSDLLISLLDIWVLPKDTNDTFKQPWIAAFPIDGDPACPPVVARAKTVDYPVVISRHAERLLNEAGIRHHHYIPHAIDTDVFKPSESSQGELRRAHNVPEDALVITMVAANKGMPSRKSFQEALAAFKMFHEKHEEAILYLHTERYPRQGLGGVEFDALIETLGLPEGSYRFVSQADYALGAIPSTYMAEIYNISDLLLCPSRGEGFGLPIAEAQACGCAVLTQDCTSMSELTINGIAIPRGQRWWLPLGYFQYNPLISDIYEGLETWFSWSEKERELNRLAGIEHMRQNYAPAVVAPMWDALLAQVEADL